MGVLDRPDPIAAPLDFRNQFLDQSGLSRLGTAND
jgi:hypothetical protein